VAGAAAIATVRLWPRRFGLSASPSTDDQTMLSRANEADYGSISWFVRHGRHCGFGLRGIQGCAMLARKILSVVRGRARAWPQRCRSSKGWSWCRVRRGGLFPPQIPQVFYLLFPW